MQLTCPHCKMSLLLSWEYFKTASKKPQMPGGPPIFTELALSVHCSVPTAPVCQLRVQTVIKTPPMMPEHSVVQLKLIFNNSKPLHGQFCFFFFNISYYEGSFYKWLLFYGGMNCIQKHTSILHVYLMNFYIFIYQIFMQYDCDIINTYTIFQTSYKVCCFLG